MMLEASFFSFSAICYLCSVILGFDLILPNKRDIIAQLSERTEHNLEKTYEDKQIIPQAPPCYKKWKDPRS